MFHLYRIYNLHPVIHENLRPEKPAKPFPRMLKEEAAAAGTESPSTRRTRKRTKPEEAPGESPYPSTAPYTVTAVSDCIRLIVTRCLPIAEQTR